MPRIAPLVAGDPAQLGPFRLTGRVGEGGQGVVYLGVSQSGERAAVKLLHVKFTGDAIARSRFARELRAAQRVASFCTARVVAADIEGDTPYIASEYIEGRSLREVVEEDGPLRGSALDRLAIGTATALTAIHQASIVHRDFKPDNVLMAADGPRVVDFGIARIIDSTGTITSRAIGTPAYMAPEQISGDDTGPYTDVFAWGATIAFAASGEMTFGGKSLAMVLNRILNHEVDLSGLPQPLRGTVRAALAKDPAARPSASRILLRLLGHTESEEASPAALLTQGVQVANPSSDDGDTTRQARMPTIRRDGPPPGGTAGPAPSGPGGASPAHPSAPPAGQGTGQRAQGQDEPSRPTGDRPFDHFSPEHAPPDHGAPGHPSSGYGSFGHRPSGFPPSGQVPPGHPASAGRPGGGEGRPPWPMEVPPPSWQSEVSAPSWQEPAHGGGYLAGHPSAGISRGMGGGVGGPGGGRRSGHGPGPSDPGSTLVAPAPRGSKRTALIAVVVALVLVAATVIVVFATDLLPNLRGPVGGTVTTEEPATATPDRTFASVVDKAKSTGELNVGVRNFLPGIALLSNDRWSGFEIDLATRIAERLGVRSDGITFRQTSREERPALLATGELDFVISTYSINERDPVTFAGPYYLAHVDVLVQADSPVTKLADLAGQRICRPAGSVSVDVVRREVNVELVNADNYTECMNLLKDGQVAAVPGDDLLLAGFADRESTRYKVLGAKLTDERYGIALPKGDVRACEAIESAIVDLYAEGVVRRLLDRHFANVEFTAEDRTPTPVDCR